MANKTMQLTTSEVKNNLKKEIMKILLLSNFSHHHASVALSFFTYSNSIRVRITNSEEKVDTSICVGGLEMTSEISNEVMESLGFTRIISPYTGPGKPELHLYHFEG